MAQLTPLSKGLIGLIVIGAMASATWHLNLKERFAASHDDTAQPAQQAPTAIPTETTATAITAAPVVAQPEKPEQAIQVLPKAAPAQKPTAPIPAPTRPAQAPGDPWADLSIDKKGSKP